MRAHDRAYWKSKAAKLLKSQRGSLRVNLERKEGGSTSAPAVGGEDGIYMGIITNTLQQVERDIGTSAAMVKVGMDPTTENPMDQLRFTRPLMYKTIRDSASAVAATGEPVLSFMTEYTPLPETHFIKMSPIEDGHIMWVAINVMRLSAVSVTHWGPQVEEFLQENSFSMENYQ